MKYLRHEAGHAFNYAYKLHRTAEWKQVFGPYRRPYRENYRPVLFSKDYVRYLPGWYAQKHPDEDFAETFAVWMTPRSSWRKKYRGWGAMEKLQLHGADCAGSGQRSSVAQARIPDITVDEMEMTVGEFIATLPSRVSLSDVTLDSDLAAMFNTSKKSKASEPAETFLRENRKSTGWTILLLDRNAKADG